ncbi:hypothetical protein N8590_04280 [bacterium]|jgi:hypothetical protein|nr:hypothetical protein [Planctomicrobium sp.]MDA7528185.1 hypothetical protein [bacterium]MDB4439884.1 hypothetical protein [Planctomicrobium sp.]MDB4731896.1 hypothetical protein [bacterium]
MPNFKKLFGYRNRHSLLVACCVLGITSITVAQDLDSPDSTAPAPADAVKPGEQIKQIISKRTSVKMVHLDSEVLELTNRIKIVDGFNAQTIAVSALSPHRIRLHAESPGVTTLKAQVSQH